MKLAILSDSHDNLDNLDQAVADAGLSGADVLIHAGDLIAPFSLESLTRFNGQVFFVYGNNDGERRGIEEAASGTNVTVAGDKLEMDFDGLSTYVTHYPDEARRVFGAGEHDLVIFGHTHEQGSWVDGERILINPGEVYGRRTGMSTWVLFDTTTKEFEFRTVTQI